MFQLLPTLSQGLFSFSPCPTSEQAGGNKLVGGDTTGTADRNGPKRYARTYNIMLSNKNLSLGGVSQGTWHSLEIVD